MLKRKIDKSTRKKVLDYFYSDIHKGENSDEDVSKYTGVPVVTTGFIIADDLRKKKEKMNNRKYNDIDWGNL